jgi:hypothetical protein
MERIVSYAEANFRERSDSLEVLTPSSVQANKNQQKLPQRAFRCNSARSSFLDWVAGAGLSGAKEAPGFRAAALQPRPPISSLLAKQKQQLNAQGNTIVTGPLKIGWTMPVVTPGRLMFVASVLSNRLSILRAPNLGIRVFGAPGIFSIRIAAGA